MQQQTLFALPEKTQEAVRKMEGWMLANYGEGPWSFPSMKEFQRTMCAVTGIKRSAFFKYLAQARAAGVIGVRTRTEVSFHTEGLQ